ncbi:U6 small nuclear RNA (adenine-(43)-N(6))-methyltransferase [Quillaja saponaria]|uniref:U6 small nuclear RNA (Adenine-(43)-N(6))-methyltransferase n=1 Tax=Quillaja saponaria TaxID=32244 RepID=A0AAD7QBR5_QUISA|nr:U6 small nuclear RNA (adenine-(43)-N(6))-methyltransferase [Quillaja saponaria]
MLEESEYSENRINLSGNIDRDVATSPQLSLDLPVWEHRNYHGPPILLGVVKDGEKFDFCQDLWEVVNGSEVMQPVTEDANGILQKWKIKVDKAMFALKTTIDEEVLEHIRDAKTLKEAWDTLATLFSKKNSTRLQLLEKFRGFVAAVQGWPNQPSLVEFENLLTGQEAMTKQMGGVSLKGEEEALYANQGRGYSKQHTTDRYNKNNDEIICVAKLTRRLLGASLWDMTAKEKGGNAVILQQESATHLEMWYVFKLGSGAISWYSKRQPTVSLSTTEAEYRSAAMDSSRKHLAYIVAEESMSTN